jgi:hypothetical protein
LAEDTSGLDQPSDGLDGDALAEDTSGLDQSTESLNADAQQSDASVNQKSQGDSRLDDQFDADKFGTN